MMAVLDRSYAKGGVEVTCGAENRFQMNERIACRIGRTGHDGVVGYGCEVGRLLLIFGFRVQGLGFRVQGSGFRVQGSGFGV